MSELPGAVVDEREQGPAPTNRHASNDRYEGPQTPPPDHNDVEDGRACTYASETDIAVEGGGTSVVRLDEDGNITKTRIVPIPANAGVVAPTAPGAMGMDPEQDKNPKRCCTQKCCCTATACIALGVGTTIAGLIGGTTLFGSFVVRAGGLLLHGVSYCCYYCCVYGKDSYDSSVPGWLRRQHENQRVWERCFGGWFVLAFGLSALGYYLIAWILLWIAIVAGYLPLHVFELHEDLWQWLWEYKDNFRVETCSTLTFCRDDAPPRVWYLEK